MKTFRMLAVLLGLASFLASSGPTTRADEWDKTTKVTFSEPVQVPGKVLQAGTYVFRLLDDQANRHIVQIYNEDHTSLITTVMAIPNERLQPTDKTVLLYDERPADQPIVPHKALRPSRISRARGATDLFPGSCPQRRARAR